MNWTEGNLARHSRNKLSSKKEIVLQQKKHFAKARSGLLNTTSRFGPPSFKNPGSSSNRISKNRSPHSPSRSLRKRRRESSCSSSLSGGTANLPTISRFFQKVQDDSQAKRQETSKQAISRAPKYQSGNEYTTFEENKRRLLMKEDWVGVKMQRPMAPLTFYNPSSGKNVWSKSYPRPGPKARHVLGRELDNMRIRQGRLRATQPQNVLIQIGSHTKCSKESPDTSRSGKTGVSSPSCTNPSWTQPPLSSSTLSLTSPLERECRGNQARKRPSITHSSNNSSPTSDLSLHDKQRHILSSSPSILQPIPQRIVSQSLIRIRSGESELACSAVAHVGKQHSSASNPQKEENDKWRRWLCMPIGEVGINIPPYESPVTAQTQPISPGVSILPRLDEYMSPSQWEIAPCATASHSCSITTSTGLGKPPLSELEVDNSEESSKEISHDEAFRHSSLNISGFETAIEIDNQTKLHVDFALQEPQRQSCSPDFPTSSILSSTADFPSVVKETLNEAAINCNQLLSISKILRAEMNTKTQKHDTIATQLCSSLYHASVQAAQDIGSPRSARNGPIDANLPRDSNQNDLDETWKKFLFDCDDSDEIQSAIFKQARQEAGEILRPSSTDYNVGVSGYAIHLGKDISIAESMLGGIENKTPESVDELVSVSDTSSTRNATVGSPAKAPMPKPVFADSYSPAAWTSTDLDTATDARAEDEDMIEHSKLALTATRKRTYGPADTNSDLNSMAVAPPRSDVGVKDSGSFRTPKLKFAPPKLFVGTRSTSKSSSSSAIDPTLVVVPKNWGNQKHPKTRLRDGRLDIKALPNYKSDPIEDFRDDEIETRRGLFRALQIEGEAEVQM